MKTNWVERVWVNGPFRTIAQLREMDLFTRLHPLRRPDRVLEIGCGRGRGARLIERFFSPKTIDAVDIDPLMIRLANEEKQRWGLDHCDFVVADAEDLPFSGGSMDAVFNFGIIHHLEDWELGVQEVARVMKPGAAFYFEEIFPALYANFIMKRLVPHPRENRFEGPEYRAALERAGLRMVPGYRESRFTIVGVAVKAA